MSSPNHNSFLDAAVLLDETADASVRRVARQAGCVIPIGAVFQAEGEPALSEPEHCEGSRMGISRAASLRPPEHQDGCVIPSGAVFQAEGGISRAASLRPPEHQAGCVIPSGAVFQVEGEPALSEPEHCEGSRMGISRAASLRPPEHAPEGSHHRGRAALQGRVSGLKLMWALAPVGRILGILLAIVALASSAFGQAMSQGILSPPASVRPPYLQNVGIEQHLDAQIPPDLAFVDDTGRPVHLGDYFGKKPLILNLVYYNCTMLCGEALAGLSGALKAVKFDAGKEFEIVTVSFNPKETPDLAAAKKKDYVSRYGRPGAAAGWHFLTGSAESINALTKAVGFQYQYDPKIQQYAHATAILVLTPQGRISRYFYGVEFPPKDLRMGLVEASEGKIGNPVDQVLLYCYHYNPATGKYGAVINNILRLSAAVTVVLLGGLLLIFFRLEKIASRRPRWEQGKMKGAPS